MRNIFKIWLLAGLVSFFMISCSEDKIETYSGPDAVNMWIGTTRDSAEMSFLALEPTLTEYDFNVELRIQSGLRNEDRDVKINLGELTTAVAGENFEVAENVTIPAGETSVIVPVKVYKKGLADIEGGLVVELVIGTSDDFIPGVYGKMKLSFAGDFPKNWYASTTSDVGAIPYFWGKCTKNKYQFVFEHLGTIDLKDYAGWNYTPIIAMQNELNAKLEKYAADHDGEWLPDDDGSKMWFSAGT